MILVSALESGKHIPAHFFREQTPPPTPPHAHSALRVEGAVVHVWLTQRELVFKFHVREMNDFFENGILLTEYLTLNYPISVLLSAWFEWMPHFAFCCQWQGIFFVSKRNSYMWRQLCIKLFLHFCFNITRLKYKRYRFSSWKAASKMLRHVKIFEIFFHMPRD